MEDQGSQKPPRRLIEKEAIEALDRKLNALGIRRGILPPPEEDGE